MREKVTIGLPTDTSRTTAGRRCVLRPRTFIVGVAGIDPARSRPQTERLPNSLYSDKRPYTKLQLRALVDYVPCKALSTFPISISTLGDSAGEVGERPRLCVLGLPAPYGRCARLYTIAQSGIRVLPPASPESESGGLLPSTFPLLAPRRGLEPRLNRS